MAQKVEDTGPGLVASLMPVVSNSLVDILDVLPLDTRRGLPAWWSLTPVITELERFDRWSWCKLL